MDKLKRFWFYLQNYRYKSLITKNFIVIFIIFILPITAMGLIVYQNMNRIVEREVSTISRDSLENTKDTIDTVLRDADVIATYISIHNSVRVFFLSDLSFGAMGDRYNEVFNQIKNYPSVHRYIDTIYVYSNKSNIVISTRDSNYLDRFSDRSWFDTYISREGNLPWVQARKKGDIYPYYITVARPAYLYDNKKLGAVIVNINVEELADMIGKSNDQSGKDIFIIDEKGDVVFNYTWDNITKNIKDIPLFDNITLKSVEGSEIALINDDEYIISTVLSPERNWRYVSFIPLRHYSEKVDWVKRFIYIFFFTGIILAIILSIFLSYKSFEPIDNILKLLEAPDELKNSKGKREASELKYIASNIVKMVSSNRHLQAELESRLVLLDKAHTLALQAQINPHFLNNTLESINWLAAMSLGRKNQVSEMISNLSKLLSLSLETDEEITTVEKEIEHAKCYIDIMKVRYSDKFDVIWDIPPELFEYKIIKLCLQPVIENSIYHGLKHIKHPGIIRFIGRIENTKIIIEAHDNGVGLSEEQVEAINQDLKKDYVLKAEHIGLRNIAQRIKLVFGEEYGILLQRGDPDGLTALIVLPQMK